MLQIVQLVKIRDVWFNGFHDLNHIKTKGWVSGVLLCSLKSYIKTQGVGVCPLTFIGHNWNLLIKIPRKEKTWLYLKIKG